MPRIACLHVPDFALAAWLRADPELRGTSLAVTDGAGPRARVVACSPEAARHGVAVGFSAAQSVAIHAGLVLRQASGDAERAARAALCDVAYSCSPRVEDAGAGTVYLDCEGAAALHGAEPDLARTLAARAARLGLDTAVGIASTKLAAQLAAHDGGGLAVIAPHEEWQFLAPLPIERLEPDAALRETLARWGIRCLGDLAALPASAVATRLGPEGARLARRARGECDQPLVPRPLPLTFEEVAELDYGLDTLEPFLFVARALLDRLIARLAVRGLICGDLRLSLGLATRGRDERTVPVAAPSNEVKALLALLRLHLEAHPPAAPVEVVRLGVVSERLRPAQLDLFRPPGPAPAQLAVTLARLTALCGTDRLGAPVVADSHRPDAYGLAAFEEALSVCSDVRIPPFGKGGFQREGEAPAEPCLNVPEGSGGASPSQANKMAMALRAIRPPCALEVFYNRGLLDFVRLASKAREAPNDYRCHGRVVTLAGPWRRQGEWWRSEAFDRDYYDVQLSDGAVYRIYCDRRTQQWFAEGVYD